MESAHSGEAIAQLRLLEDDPPGVLEYRRTVARPDAGARTPSKQSQGERPSSGIAGTVHGRPVVATSIAAAGASGSHPHKKRVNHGSRKVDPDTWRMH
jgi:hypothetical protein